MSAPRRAALKTYGKFSPGTNIVLRRVTVEPRPVTDQVRLDNRTRIYVRLGQDRPSAGRSDGGHSARRDGR